MKGKEARLTEAVEPRQADVVDLMERLRQSLQGTGTGRRRAARSAKSTTRKSTARGKTKRTRAA
jgi:non-homologous end joining protein Ku